MITLRGTVEERYILTPSLIHRSSLGLAPIACFHAASFRLTL